MGLSSNSRLYAVVQISDANVQPMKSNPTTLNYLVVQSLNDNRFVLPERDFIARQSDLHVFCPASDVLFIASREQPIHTEELPSNASHPLLLSKRRVARNVPVELKSCH